ncbi:MAG TPA: AsmA-like C-terminal region-containing protein, partial [Cytophagaceae bacterium]|nr:AsmA-like C-terminal region-containing protein [Cytophagaceae bacterium]
DSLKLMPVINASMHLSNGSVQSSEFPEPIRDINLSATAISNGNIKTSTFLLDYFKFILDKEAFEINAFVKNFDDPNYEATLKGIIDFAKMTKIYPIEGTTLTGRMKADITTKGTLSEVRAGKYGNTKSSGTMDFTNLVYKSSDLPQGFTMKTGSVALNSDRLTLSGMTGFIGKSDYLMNGYLSNYMGYMFGGTDTVLHSTITFNSTKFDVNEWMDNDSTSATSAPSNNTTAQAIEIPGNLDVLFNAALKEVLYSNMTMTDMAGAILFKNRIVTMKNLDFNSMGGSFLTNGNYNAQNIQKPSFDLNMKIENLAVREAYKTFGTIKKLAPIANYIEGNMNMSVIMNGLLDQGMMPVYTTLNGKGNLGMASAKILNNPITGGIASLTQIKNIDPMEMKDVKINYTIQDGNLVLAPFTIKTDKTELSVLKGLNKFDGSINYDVELNTPSGSLGSFAGSALSKFAGSNVALPPNVIIDLNLTGPYEKPKVKILKTNLGETSKTALKNAATEQLMNSPQVKQIQQQADQVKQQAQEELKKQQDAAQQQLNTETKILEQKTKQAEDSVRKKAVDALKKSFPKF